MYLCGHQNGGFFTKENMTSAARAHQVFKNLDEIVRDIKNSESNVTPVCLETYSEICERLLCCLQNIENCSTRINLSCS